MEGMRRFIILNFSDWRVSLKKGRLKSDDPFVGSIAKYISSTAGSFRLVLQQCSRDRKSRRCKGSEDMEYVRVCLHSSLHLPLVFQSLRLDVSSPS